MIKVFKTIFLFLLLIGFQPVKSDNWWHVKLISFLDTKIQGHHRPFGAQSWRSQRQ